MSNGRAHSIRRLLGTIAVKTMVPVLTLCFGHLGSRGIRFWRSVFYGLSYPFLYGKRRIALANLTLAFPDMTDEERREILKRNSLFMIELGLDWCHSLASPQEMDDRIHLSPEAQRLFDRHLHDDTPAFYCTPHFGNWELESHNRIITGRPMAIVTAKFTLPIVNDLMTKFRCGRGDDVTVIYSEGAALGVMRAIRAKRDVGILIDQCVSPRHGGVMVPFFGVPATTSLLPAMIARRTGTRVFVYGCRKCEDGGFVIEAEELPKPAKEYPDDLSLTRDIIAGFERLIRKAPEQYLWIYPRWRYRLTEGTPEELSRFPFYATHIVNPNP